jgi:hypothetical protein
VAGASPVGWQRLTGIEGHRPGVPGWLTGSALPTRMSWGWLIASSNTAAR